jgi:hypothetical protein
MSGMPAWEGVLAEDEMWPLAVLVTDLAETSETDFQTMIATASKARAAAAASAGPAEGESSGEDASAGSGDASGNDGGNEPSSR